MSDFVLDGYISLSEATERLSLGMFGGLRRPDLTEIHASEPKLKVSYGPRREMARQELYKAITSGNLEVVTFSPRQSSSDQQRHLVVAPSMLKSFVRARGGLPDHPHIFVSGYINSPTATQELTEALRTTGLMVAVASFERWYRAERAKRHWPSQQRAPLTSLRTNQRRRGAPTKQTEEAEHAIIARLNDGRWHGSQGIAALRRSLLSTFGNKTPSEDTVSRLVRRLLKISGDPRLRLKHRRKPQRY